MKRIIHIILISFFALQVANAQEYILPTDSSSLNLLEVGEVVIKASKDNITFRSIPASVSVISSKELENKQIRSLSDISASTPNFFMPDYGSKLTSPVYIRGIGSRINAPSVGLYVDNVPYFEKAAFNFDFFDITRIEVLRGPQGTLFGRNTMGGIINIVTTSPLDYQGSHINLTTGTYGAYSLNVGHYGKIRNKLGYSVAANVLHNDGYYTNIFTGEKVDKINSLGLRSRIIYEINNKISIENIAGFESSSQGGYPYSLYIDTTGRAAEVNYNQYSSYSRNLFSDALLIRYSGRKTEITLTSAYQYLDDNQSIDQDFTPDSLYFIIQKQNQNMLSQEILVRSKGSSKINWLFGGYAFHQAFDNSVNANVYTQNMDYLKTYDHRIGGLALFHQTTVSDFLVKNLKLTAGIRLDSEKDVMTYVYDRTLNGNFTNLADTTYPALTSLEVIPRFALNYRIKKADIYAVVARGYKTGGFNSTFERPEDLTFEPEFSWNYEAGFKGPLFNGRVKADLAVFYIDWKNQQIYQTVPSGRGSMLKNAGHTASKGVEASMTTSPFRGTELMVSYGYTNATFLSNILNATTDYTGNFLPYVPRHTFSVNVMKAIVVENSPVLDQIKINASYNGNGKIYWSDENSHMQTFYGLLDAKVSFIRKSIQFDIWSKNLLNTYYESFYFEAIGNKYVQTGKPMRLGINLSVKF